MKKVILGIIIGFMLASVTFAYADDVKQFIANEASFPILVNGQQLDTAQKPAVVINGSTYLPLRALGNALNVPVNWNSNLNRVEVGSTPQNTTVSTNTDSGLDIKILSSRTVIKSEIKNRIPNYGFVFKLVNISITNNGSSTVNIKPTDISMNYKISPKQNPGVVERIKLAEPSFDGSIVKGSEIEISKYSGIFADSEIKFGDIAPGQTIQGTILFEEADTNIDWFSVSCKGNEVRSN